jgi:hypothetical protein
MEKKPIVLIPQIHASDFPSDVEEEMIDNDINTHYQNDSVYIDWKDDTDMPSTQEWLINTYGEEIKNYDTFSIVAT